MWFLRKIMIIINYLALILSKKIALYHIYLLGNLKKGVYISGNVGIIFIGKLIYI